LICHHSSLIKCNIFRLYYPDNAYSNYRKSTQLEGCAEFHNRTRSAKKRIYSIAKVLKRRTNEVRQDVKEITASILSTTRKVVG